MTISAYDFNLIQTSSTMFGYSTSKATPEEVAALNAALVYLQRSFVGDGILEGMVKNHVTIDFDTAGVQVDRFKATLNKSSSIINQAL